MFLYLFGLLELVLASCVSLVYAKDSDKVLASYIYLGLLGLMLAMLLWLHGLLVMGLFLCFSNLF